MIVWSKYYRFPAEEVSCVEATSNNGETKFPYKLTVYLKSGTSFAVSYADEKSRSKDMDSIVRQVDIARRNDYEKLYNQIYLLRDTISRIDKRQLRIWRQLRDLLGVKPMEE